MSASALKASPATRLNPARGGYGSAAFGGAAYGGTGYYSATIGHIWDAMLSEGRNWWLFASSDFHSRSVPEYSESVGAYRGPRSQFQQPVQDANTINSGWRGATATHADFWPGEYQKDYVFVKSAASPPPRMSLNGMRSGNSFIVQGDLIRGLDFTAQGSGPAANMGEKLTVSPNQPGDHQDQAVCP